jgi:hypothetical protein
MHLGIALQNAVAATASFLFSNPGQELLTSGVQRLHSPLRSTHKITRQLTSAMSSMIMPPTTATLPVGHSTGSTGSKQRLPRQTTAISANNQPNERRDGHFIQRQHRCTRAPYSRKTMPAIITQLEENPGDPEDRWFDDEGFP